MACRDQLIRPLWPALVGTGAALLACLVLAQAIPAKAEEGDLYQATVIVTGTDMRSRPTGFARALRQVLVKLSGETRLRNDARLDPFAVHADRFVASFGYKDQMAGIKVHDDQGTYDRSYDLTVRFDPARIDKLLADLSERPFGGERKPILPILRVRGVTGATYLVSTEAPQAADQRVSFFNAGILYGTEIEVPRDKELAALSVSVVQFPPELGEAEPSRMLVSGTLDFQEGEPIGWVASFHTRFQGADYAWGIKGANFDEAVNEMTRGALRLMSGHGAPQ